MPQETVGEDQAHYHPLGVLPITLRVNDSFEEFVRLNPDLIVEQNSNGEIVIMSPTGGESADLNSELNFQLRAWSKKFGGATFDSSVIFCLPDVRNALPMQLGFPLKDGRLSLPRIERSIRRSLQILSWSFDPRAIDSYRFKRKCNSTWTTEFNWRG